MVGLLAEKEWELDLFMRVVVKGRAFRWCKVLDELGQTSKLCENQYAVTEIGVHHTP